MSLTTHLLTKNNEETIQQCLESIQHLNSKIIICDLGSKDNTIAICKQFTNQIFETNQKDQSAIRNKLITQGDWQFWIEPWETLTGEFEFEEDAYRINIIQGTTIVKQTRLWKTGEKHFVRPIYESLYPETKDTLLQCFLSGMPPINPETIKILNEWNNNQPHICEVDYYLAYAYLSINKYTHFLNHAEHYLFKENSLLLNYYYAMIQLLVKQNTEKCINHLIPCLMEEPTMAEFWCLLGDAFFKLKQFKRASAFYDNAILLGSKRLNDDAYPIEILKYKDYPEKMLDACKRILLADNNI